MKELFEGAHNTLFPANSKSRDLVGGNCPDRGKVHFHFILLSKKSVISGVPFPLYFNRLSDKVDDPVWEPSFTSHQEQCGCCDGGDGGVTSI